MKSIIVGTAGHIDHGKTALVKVLTGIDADRLAEEKRRGITIDLGFANLELAGPDGERLQFGFVDVPGHERFIRNMLAGVGGIDLVLFVIAADEGIMPHTREHFDICQLLAVVRGIQVHGQRTEKAMAGERTALNIAGVDKDELARGMTLATRGLLHVTSKIDAKLSLLSTAKPLKTAARVHFHAFTAEAIATVN